MRKSLFLYTLLLLTLSTAHAEAPATQLDELFHNYATCFSTSTGKSLHWKVLKAIAFGESGLNIRSGLCQRQRTQVLIPNDEVLVKKQTPRKCTKHAKYLGLFQVDDTNCKAALDRIRSSADLDRSFNCTAQKRTTADLNIMVTANHLTASLEVINARCPKASVENKLSLLYIRHNDGVGVFNLVMGLIKDGPDRPAACSLPAITMRLRNYYKTAIANGTTPVKTVELGMQKLTYGRKKIIPFAKQLNLTSIDTVYSESDRMSCPF